MKKIPLHKIILLSFSILFTQFSFAQVPEKLKNNDKKLTKNISRSDYSSFKEKGELSDKYEYKIIGNELVPQNIAARPFSPNSLTPCDPLPTTGNVGFVGQVDVDDDYVVVPLSFNFCFYGTNYNSLNLTENGNVQFSTNSTSYNSTGFPSSTVNMIAPFWADAESMVQSGGRTYGKIYIDSHPTYMIITWDSMGYYNGNVDKLNSFQLVLTNGLDPMLPPGKNVGFYYKKMQWTTGDASTGTNGFPTTQPGTPATIGANQGNGVDYFLIGRFGVTGTIYDGPLGNSDGVSWLDGKRFFFNVCPPVGSNQAPASTLIGPCDTVKLCGNDSLIIKNAFIGPELTQTVSITASAPTLGSSFSYSVLQTGNNTDINILVNGNTAPAGYHVVTMNATDNGVPSLTSSQTFVVFVDQTSVNNLNGQIVFTPTVGVCPGGSTTASVVVSGGVPTSYLWNNNASGTSTSFTVTPALDSTVYVTIKSGQCQKTITNYIRVKPVPVANITGNLSLCSGTGSTTVLTASNTLNFAAQSPYTYAWLGSPTAPSPATTQTTTATRGTYSVTVTNKYNCKSTAVVTVTLNATPAFTVVPTNTIVCSGTNVPLNVNFNTFPPTNCGLAAIGCAAASSRTIGTGTSTNGNTSFPTPYSNYYKSSHFQMLFKASELTAAGVVAGKISSMAFNISSLNSFSVALKNYTIKMKCTSVTSMTSTFDNTGLSQVYFNSSYMPTTGINTHNYNQAYEWDGSSNILVDICYDRFTSPSTYVSNGSTAAFYTATAFTSVRHDESDSEDLCGTSNSASTSSNRPNVRFGNCQSVPSASEFSYSWSPITGLSNPNIANPIANLSSSILYSVVVTPTAATTCSNVSTTSLTITTPVTPTINAVSALCSNASSFTLSALPTGGTWSLTTSTSTSGVFSPSLATIGNNTIEYTYGGTGCSQTSTSTVVIEKFVPSTITGTINFICLPSPTISLSTALTTSTLGAGIWSGTGVSGTTFDPTIAGAGTHTLTYSTNSSPTTSLCPSSSTIAVSVGTAIQPTITPVSSRCTNSSTLALSATPTGGTWVGSGISSGGILTPSLASVGNNIYSYSFGSASCSAVNSTTISIEQYVPSTITGTISPLCISNSTINLSTSLTTSTLGMGVWSGNGVTGNLFDPAIAGAAIHTLTYSTQSSPTASLCPSTSTITVTVNSVVQPTITAAGPFCDNFISQLMTATPTGGMWSSSVGSSISPNGLFTPSSILVGNNKIYYTLTNAPCIKKDSTVINIVRFIPATLTGTGTFGPYCIYDPAINLQTIATATGGVWSGNGVSTSSFTPSAAGAGTSVITYSTNPAPSGLCPDSETISILVNPKPEANAVPSNSGGCNYPWSVDFMTTSYPTGIASWDFGDGSPKGNGLIVTHIYSTPGTYTGTIFYTDNVGCKDTTKTITAVTIFSVPVAAFEPSLETTTIINPEIVFTNQTSDLPNNTYTWNFGDLTNSNDVSPTYLFLNSGEYFVTLIAVNSNNCQDTAVRKITINPDVVLYVPNAFTPGGDGLNDVFQIFLPPTGADYSTFSLLIYDRWGEVVFKTNDVNESWTGAKNNAGPVLQQGIFIWKIEFRDEKKKFYSKVGHVSLLNK
jgi:gliding motility-associated-like protein